MHALLTNLPERTNKPREEGITMVMDKGLSINQCKEFIAMNSEYTDIVKLGFGTSIISNNVKEKVKIYQEANINVYLGGTLFEAFIIRDMYQEYKQLLLDWEINMCEVSDGSISIPHSKKCEYITDLSKDYIVLSEVGSKDEKTKIDTQEWVTLMNKELDAGSWKVIAEAREGGNIGIFNDTGEIKSDLVKNIISSVPNEKVIWESPKKNQQSWFINLLGCNVNLGNINYNDVIPLETLRVGLRGDTFFNYLT